MNDKEYLRLRKRLHDDHKRKLEALDLVWQMSNDCAPPKPQKPHATNPKEGAERTEPESKSKTTQSVEEAVEAAGDRFSTKDIAKWIAEKLGTGAVERSTIPHSLKRMRTIELLEKGQGKRPSFWRKLHTADVSEAAKPEPSTQDQADDIKSLVKTRGVVPALFRENVLLGRFGVERLAQLTKGQADSLIMELKSQPEVG